MSEKKKGDLLFSKVQIKGGGDMVNISVPKSLLDVARAVGFVAESPLTSEEIVMNLIHDGVKRISENYKDEIEHIFKGKILKNL